MVTMVTARKLISTTSTPTLATRLHLNDNNNNKCWDALFQLQLCTGEIIMFFLNGETYLGSGCCNALLTIAQICWPDMITTLGLTQQEGDILRGYCDEEAHHNNKSMPSSAMVNASHPFSNNNNNNVVN
ncbi:hypothetical protein RIF29_11090 [Crotalaria pallida]|uniref:Prolamin-like domain-containing protein n=1 Tax=Crotalaria pallida TaxID=3830 RepID=A0AAN9IK72_CROPI